jgi:hypothetical protein
MGGSSWRPLHGVEQSRLREARLQALHAVQWLARAARAFVPPQRNDGHTSLGWTEAPDGFTTHPMQDGLRLGLQLKDLTLVLRGGTAASSQTFPLHGRSHAQARQWLGQQLAARGYDSGALDAPSPYAMPVHPIASGATYDAKGNADALAELAAWYANAAHAIVPIRDKMTELNFDASPVRCWPHHFDLATSISFPAKAAGTTAYVGVGLEPGDAYYDEPYFYVTLSPKPDQAALPPLPKIGHWHMEDFIGAIAPAHAILASENPQAAIEVFLQAAVDGVIKVVS